MLLVWKIRQGLQKAISTERISNYVLFFFKEDLAQHFKEEEQLLFSKLPADDKLRRKAEKDHQVIYNLVSTIDQKKNDSFLLSQLADELEQHIRFEERELFNHLQNSISEIELELIAGRMSNNSKEIEEKWTDAFWN